jgi:hypothetical protein
MNHQLEITKLIDEITGESNQAKALMTEHGLPLPAPPTSKRVADKIMESPTLADDRSLATIRSAKIKAPDSGILESWRVPSW